jgi:endonuclease/exonuclease/phosphatase family metal-dependent hydrolase
LCLQEVNGQHVAGHEERSLVALDQLLAGTPYAGYQRVATHARSGRGVADVHNLVTLARCPIRTYRDVWHDFVVPLRHRVRTAIPPALEPHEIRFDRAVLLTEITLPQGETLNVVDVHLCAPLAANVAGQKLDAFVWKSVGGWGEGYFLAAIRRAAQALEVRLLLDRIFDKHPDALLAVAGDCNAEDHEVPLRLLVGAEEHTGNPALAGRSLVVLDRALPEDRRCSVLHHGRPQMLDHILVSPSLNGSFKTIEVHNEAIGDELMAYARRINPSASSRAALAAEFTH